MESQNANFGSPYNEQHGHSSDAARRFMRSVLALSLRLSLHQGQPQRQNAIAYMVMQSAVAARFSEVCLLRLKKTNNRQKAH